MRTGFSDDEKAKIGAYIRKLREEHHISQSELAEKLQVIEQPFASGKMEKRHLSPSA